MNTISVTNEIKIIKTDKTTLRTLILSLQIKIASIINLIIIKQNFTILFLKINSEFTHPINAMRSIRGAIFKLSNEEIQKSIDKCNKYKFIAIIINLASKLQNYYMNTIKRMLLFCYAIINIKCRIMFCNIVNPIDLAAKI